MTITSLLLLSFMKRWKRRLEEEKETRKLIFTAKRLQIVPLEDTEHAKARLGNRWKKKILCRTDGTVSRGERKEFLAFNCDSFLLVFWQSAFLNWSLLFFFFWGLCYHCSFIYRCFLYDRDVWLLFVQAAFKVKLLKKKAFEKIKKVLTFSNELITF